MFGSRRISRLRGIVSSLLLVTSHVAFAYDLDVNSKESVFATSKQMAADLVSFYHGNKPGGTPGLLPEPYYWWEAGAMFGALIEYWAYTKDDTYNDLVSEGLLAQVGPKRDYMPDSQTLTEGNDDQGFWGLAVMSAAEFGFPDPPLGQPQWLALAQAVFNTQAPRWETGTCNGGLRWQIFQWNKGYDYKNSISQGCFFALGARLALYTGNQTYADWAEKTWDWMFDTKLIDNETWNVYDGAYMGSNCTDVTPYQFTYNPGIFILGAAAMYNRTKSDVWKQRLDNLLHATSVFFPDDQKIMVEMACETVNRCNLDQSSFKAYLSRWFGAITSWAPDTIDYVLPYLQASAEAAAGLCKGGKNGRMCGLVWNKGKYDGKTGVGPQMASLEVTLNTMAAYRPHPFTAKTGGTSIGDENAGSDDIGRDTPRSYGPLSAGNQFAGALLTLMMLGGWFALLTFMLVDETSTKTVFQQAREAIISGIAATGAFSAAVLGRQKDNDYLSEKADLKLSPSLSDSSSHFSSDPSVIATAPVTIGPVRSAVDNTPSRSSSMPLGWPHNTLARGSSSSIRRQSSAEASPVISQESNLRHATLPPKDDTIDDEPIQEENADAVEAVDAADTGSEKFEDTVEQPAKEVTEKPKEDEKAQNQDEKNEEPTDDSAERSEEDKSEKSVGDSLEKAEADEAAHEPEVESSVDEDDKKSEAAKIDDETSK